MYLQRVLEHCRKPATQSAVMKEIVQHAFALTEDKYGNYVVQVSQCTLYMCITGIISYFCVDLYNIYTSYMPKSLVQPNNLHMLLTKLCVLLNSDF